MKKDISKLIINMFRLKSIKFTKSFLEQIVRFNAGGDNVITISRVLDYYMVENMVVKLSIDNISEVPFLFFLFLKDHTTLLVQGHSNDNISYLNSKGKDRLMKIDSLSRKWDGVGILVGDGGLEHNLTDNLKNEKRDKIKVALILSLSAILVVSKKLCK